MQGEAGPPAGYLLASAPQKEDQQAKSPTCPLPARNRVEKPLEPLPHLARDRAVLSPDNSHLISKRSF